MLHSPPSSPGLQDSRAIPPFKAEDKVGVLQVFEGTPMERSLDKRRPATGTLRIPVTMVWYVI